MRSAFLCCKFYALFENGHHRETITELPREIELDMRGGPVPVAWPAGHSI